MGYPVPVSKLIIELSDETSAKLAELAARLGTSVESLVTAGVVDMVNGTDKEFNDAMYKVLDKNQELYKRLA